MKLYSYWRSTAAYRVRIALALKELDYEYIAVDLVKEGGEQKQRAYREKNPQGLVPLLETDNTTVAQSLAILRYLDHQYPEPALFPKDPLLNARIEAFVLGICCDIHPLNNLRVLKFLESDMEIKPNKRMTWYHHWLKEGFDAIETTLNSHNSTYCFTEQPTAAEAFFPQHHHLRSAQLDFPFFSISV